MTDIEIPHVEIRTTHYYRDGEFVFGHASEAYVTEMEQRAMDICFTLGEQALQDGNPPIGAVLINNETGQFWGAKTIDKTTPKLLGHAEVLAYEMAHSNNDVSDDLRNCTLVSTAQPCNTCISPYAEGKIGKVVYAAPRWAIFQLAGIMRKRTINMHELLLDGDTETLVIEGYQAEKCLGNFALWKILKEAGHVKA